MKAPQSYPPKADPPTPSCKQKPNWEKRILNHLVIDTLDEKEGRRRSLTLKIELQTTDTAETKSVTALLDSGATGMFINQEYVKKGGFTTRTLSNLIPIRNVDGTLNEPAVPKSCRTSVLRSNQPRQTKHDYGPHVVAEAQPRH